MAARAPAQFDRLRTDDPIRRAGRVAVLQHVEATFGPLPYDQSAARLYSQICAAVRTAGWEPRRRTSDLMIAATAASNQLPLYTANPDFRADDRRVTAGDPRRDALDRSPGMRVRMAGAAQCPDAADRPGK